MKPKLEEIRDTIGWAEEWAAAIIMLCDYIAELEARIETLEAGCDEATAEVEEET